MKKSKNKDKFRQTKTKSCGTLCLYLNEFKWTLLVVVTRGFTSTSVVVVLQTLTEISAGAGEDEESFQGVQHGMHSDHLDGQ